MSKKNRVDLGALDTVAAANKGVNLELLHPVTRKPLGVFISILGKDSDAFQQHVRDVANEDMRRAAMARKRGKDVDVPTVEQSEARGIDLLVVCTTGWYTKDGDVSTPTLDVNGQELPFSAGNAKKVYTSYPWIRQQVDAGIADLENFMKA